MTNPTLIPFKVEHLLALQGTEHEEFWILIQKEKNPSFTAVVDDQILGCGGVIVSAPGVGVAWACFSELINQHKVWTTKTVRRILQDIIMFRNLHRVESAVFATNYKNHKWIEMLGFNRENGCARFYTPDKQDAVRYELVRG